MGRLIFLHGFTQTHHHWHRCAFGLAGRTGSEPVFVDLPGHGLAADDRSGTIDDVGDRLVRLAGPGTYLGYSMGGRVALEAAVTGSPDVERLVLIGATPGLVDDSARAERRRLDHDRATTLERVGVERFVDEWMSMPMFARLPADPAGLARRLDNTVGGLTHSLRSYGTGSQTPLWDLLAEITVPVLVVAGRHDGPFVAMGEAMAAAMPDAVFVTIAGAGHAAHIERPEEAIDVIGQWLAGVGPSPGPDVGPTGPGVNRDRDRR